MKRRIFVAFSLGGVVVASFVVLTRDGPATEALASLPLANHGAALLTALVEVLLRGVRLLVLSSIMGLRITLPTATLTQLAADGGAAVTPLRSGADPGKALVLHRRGTRGGHIGALILGEALAEATMVPLAAVAVALTVGASPAALAGPLVWSATALTLVTVAVRVAPSRNAKAPGLLLRLGMTPARWERTVRSAADFRSAAGTLKRMRWPHLALLVLSTLAHIAARLLVLPALLGPAAVAVDAGALVAWPFFLIYGGSLIPAPGGAGLVEAGFMATVGPAVATATEAGVAAEPGVYAFWWRVYAFHLTAALGWWTLAVHGRRRRRERRETA